MRGICSGIKGAAFGFAATLACCVFGAEADSPEEVEARTASVGAIEGPEVLPAHVFVAARLLRFDLMALRHVLDKPREDAATAPMVLAASSRHVFNQAQVLFRKTHQLGEEVAGDRALPLEAVDADWRRSSARPAPTDREVTSADVLRVIVDTRDRVKALLRLLNINVSLRDPPSLDLGKRPADVLGEILRIKRQLNRMLDREYTMRNVYELVLQAIDYAGDLGGGYPPLSGSTRTLQPVDVYERLVANFGVVRDIGSEAGAQLMDIRFENALTEDDVTASDIYDFAAMLHGELGYLAMHKGVEHTRLPRGEYTMPATVLHWHVYQLIEVLETQLRSLRSEPAVEARADAEAD